MKKIFKKNWPLFGLLLLLTLVGMYVIKQAKNLVTKPHVAEVLLKEGLKLKDVRFTQGDVGQGIKWSLDAKEVTLSKDKSVVYFEGFSLVVEPKDSPKILVKGNSGQYEREMGLIKLEGDLKADSEDGYSFITQHLVIDERQNILSSKDMVKISGPYFSVVGKGLWMNWEKKIARVLSNVTTVIHKELVTS